MAAPDDDYVRRERLLLLHHSGDRYLVPPGPGERYIPPPDRYLPPPAPAPSDRYHPASPATSDRYNPPPAPAPNERYVPPLSPSRYDRYTDRYQDRYYQDRFSPQSPSSYHSERSYLCGNLDRYISSERFLQSPPTSVTPGGPGDPYMRRDLGYHHHYRLPPPPGFYHPVYQRTLPSAPMRHHVVHHRGHVRCCPSLYPQDYVREGNGGGGSARDYVTSPVLPRGRTCSNRLNGNGSATSTGNTPVEYVGSSGGRYVSTTPPLPRCSSVSDVKNGECVNTRRPCDSMTLCCTTRRPLPQQCNTQLLTPHHNSVW